ncbi:uncharacterized protein LOC127772099 [Oryza glaberrima]|uniref:uncharacterized protein LOC127772099 n=1 Tax=Oryza glaberrima TaxID=4538 RepID=UPI00224C02FF|nr:uncharacterized protein LOC127772099 [Oryza glaberrima]
MPPELVRENMAATYHNALPSLECLSIAACGIMGKWLSLILQYAQALQDLELYECEQITGLSIGEEESSQPNLMSTPETLSLGHQGDSPTSSARDGLVRIPSNLISSLKHINICDCPGLTYNGNDEGFAKLTSLESLRITNGAKLLSSLVHGNGYDERKNINLIPLSLEVLELKGYDLPEELVPGFLRNPNRLKKFSVMETLSLKSLQLQSCTALEELEIANCESLSTLEGLQSLRGLKNLIIWGCPILPQWLRSSLEQVQELLPRLERLQIDDPSVLTTSFCKHLTSLQRLKLFYCNWELVRQTDEQDIALQLLTSLQELSFSGCHNLRDFPVDLYSFPSLKRLAIYSCKDISRLPEKGLPPSLEELDINDCSEELNDQCRMLPSKLKVKINQKYVN